MMTFEDAWEAVRQVAVENRHELVLSGPSVSELIEDRSGLDRHVFDLHNLNYLSITQTCLAEIPDAIGELTNLTTLVLHSNEVAALPPAIGRLVKLKLLDCSRNKLTRLPQELDSLPQLSTLNLASNSLVSLPSQSANAKLSVLDLSNNRFEIFPDVCHPELVHLFEIRVNGNAITEIPAAIGRLQALKVLNVADNSITGKSTDLTTLFAYLALGSFLIVNFCKLVLRYEKYLKIKCDAHISVQLCRVN